GSPDHSIPGEVLARFATATTTREERRQVLAHLLSGCEVCQASLRRHLPPARGSGNVVDLTAAYGEAIDRAVARALGAFAGRGAGSPEQLAAQLAAHPPSPHGTPRRNP